MSSNQKIIFITRLYSAFERSMQSGEWSVTGMPTVYKLFERLNARNIDFEVYFTSNTEAYQRNKTVTFDNVNARFHIMAPLFSVTMRFPLLLNVINSVYTKFKVLFSVLINSGNDRCIYYVDRENVVLGAFLSLIGKKVVLRLHGVATLYQKFSEPWDSWKKPIRKLAFRANFFKVIGTDDGSPVIPFLENFVNKKSEKEILVNGVDEQPDTQFDIREKHGIDNGDPIILFVSRLVEGRGVRDFIKVMTRLLEGDCPVNALLVGEGELRGEIENLLPERIILVGSVEHKLIMNYYIQSDITVSLVQLGDLSNTVLESIAAGTCVIELRTEKNSYHDERLKGLFEKYIVTFDSNDIDNSLYFSLKELIENPDNLKKCKTGAEILKKELIKTWDQRIDSEIRIILT